MTSAREVVEACARAAVAELVRQGKEWGAYTHAWSEEHYPPIGLAYDGEIYTDQLVLAVIRALAAQEPTQAMLQAWSETCLPPGVEVVGTHVTGLRAMLLALADGYEREGGG